ncbi:MAG: hypothetical protein II768_07875, partial [Clostridia bacterium]|nr:hypothetical protein [Clostridia bacterium]
LSADEHPRERQRLHPDGGGIRRVAGDYAHSHGESRFHDSVEGMKNGVFYRLVSGDFLRWMPEKIMD